MSYFQKMRRQSITQTEQLIKEHEGEELEKLISLISYETGFSLKKIREYIQILIDAGRLSYEDYRIYVAKKNGNL